MTTTAPVTGPSPPAWAPAGEASGGPAGGEGPLLGGCSAQLGRVLPLLGLMRPGPPLPRRYKAPELLFSSRAYSPAVDLWSAGCLLGEVLTGRPLFPGTSDIDQICRIAKALGSIDENDWPGGVGSQEA